LTVTIELDLESDDQRILFAKPAFYGTPDEIKKAQRLLSTSKIVLLPPGSSVIKQQVHGSVIASETAS
jgi:hypothetical protein